jgi:hypothetical protein
MESAIGAVNLVQRENHKFSDRAFHDALISDRVSIVPTTVLVSILSAFMDRFANIIGLKAISSRAPPRFKF